MNCKAPFQWDELLTVYFWKAKKWQIKEILKRGVQFKKGETKGWYFLSIYGRRPFKFLQHGGHFYMSFEWLWRFAITVPKKRGWRWD